VILNPLRRAPILFASIVLFAPGRARATPGFETPDTGVSQIGRGGAWLARADDPLATYFNPAALVRQSHGVHLGAFMPFRSHCFERLGPDGRPISPGRDLAAPGEEVCADIPPIPAPQLAGVVRFHKRFALGLAFVSPHGHPKAEWPTTIVYTEPGIGDTPHPAPQRYLVVEEEVVALFPTLSASVAILPSLSVGAGFTWGLVAFRYSRMTEATSPVRPSLDDYTQDVRSEAEGFDGFVPGFVVGVLWSPTRRFDVAAWYRFSDAVRTSVDIKLDALAYGPGGRDNDAPTTTEVADAGTFEHAMPMEARIGFRYHHPRRERSAPPAWMAHLGEWGRDALSSDLFDVELDLSWTHNSALDTIEVRFRPGIPINGAPGGTVPENADVPNRWKETLGARLGGEWIAIPQLLAVRAGGFFESEGQDDENLNLDFHLGARIGVGAGATVRVGPVDVTAAYQHTFFLPLDNEGQGTVRGLSGDATTGFRTRQAINGGRETSSLDEIALGATLHF
jgi:long-chain fatty acid transport protein